MSASVSSPSGSQCWAPRASRAASSPAPCAAPGPPCGKRCSRSPPPLEDQRRDHVSLQNAVKTATEDAAAEVAADLTAGRAAIGAPTTSWLADASSGGVLAPLVAAPANLVESWRFRRSTTARRAAVGRLREVSVNAAGTLIGDACERAERAIRERLQRTSSGTQLTDLVA